MYLANEIKTALRKKRGVLNLTKSEVAGQIGISPLTHGRLESPMRNERVHQRTYERIAEWLAKDY